MGRFLISSIWVGWSERGASGIIYISTAETKLRTTPSTECKPAAESLIFGNWELEGYLSRLSRCYCKLRLRKSRSHSTSRPSNKSASPDRATERNEWIIYCIVRHSWHPRSSVYILNKVSGKRLSSNPCVRCLVCQLALKSWLIRGSQSHPILICLRLLSDHRIAYFCVNRIKYKV